MKQINYITHLNGVFTQFSKDSRLNPTHISLYVALFQLWNTNRFTEVFFVNREEVMQYSKIGSKSTYHRCIKELSHWNYIVYYPSHNPFKGSKIKMLKCPPEPVEGSRQSSESHYPKTRTSSGQALVHYRPKIETSTGQALVPLYKHNKTLINNKNINKLDQPKNEKEVIDFFKKEKWPINEAKKFYNHYQGIGWKVGGKTKIVNWQATARNWMLKAEELKNNKQQSHFKDNLNPPPSGESKGADNLKTTKNKNYNEPL